MRQYPKSSIGVILGITKTTSAPKTAARNDPIARVATSRAILCTPAAPVRGVSFGSISVVAFIGPELDGVAHVQATSRAVPVGDDQILSGEKGTCQADGGEPRHLHPNCCAQQRGYLVRCEPGRNKQITNAALCKKAQVSPVHDPVWRVLPAPPHQVK